MEHGLGDLIKVHGVALRREDCGEGDGVSTFRGEYVD